MTAKLHIIDFPSISILNAYRFNNREFSSSDANNFELEYKGAILNIYQLPKTLL